MSFDPFQADVVIGRPASDCIALRIPDQEHLPEPYWWLTAELAIRVSPWSGTFAFSLCARELVHFRAQLELMQATVSGSASLDLLEHNLELRIAVDDHGCLRITGVARADSVTATHLEFELGGLDQTDLPPLIEQLTGLCGRFPAGPAPT